MFCPQGLSKSCEQRHRTAGVTLRLSNRHSLPSPNLLSLPRKPTPGFGRSNFSPLLLGPGAAAEWHDAQQVAAVHHLGWSGQHAQGHCLRITPCLVPACLRGALVTGCPAARREQPSLLARSDKPDVLSDALPGAFPVRVQFTARYLAGSQPNRQDKADK